LGGDQQNARVDWSVPARSARHATPAHARRQLRCGAPRHDTIYRPALSRAGKLDRLADELRGELVRVNRRMLSLSARIPPERRRW